MSSDELDRLQGTVFAVGKFDAGARSALDELPSVALEIDRRRSLAGRARPRRTIVLALEGDAKAFLLLGGDGRIGLGLCQRTGNGKRRKRGRDCAGQNKRANCILRRHDLSSRVAIISSAK